MIDANLLSYATPRQIEYLEAIEKHGSIGRAEKALGLSNDLIGKSMRGLKARAAREGWVEHPVAEPYKTETAEPRKGKKIMVLCDVQAKPGTDFTYLQRIGRYAAEKRPDVIVCIGDFADMPSLSSYDVGKKSFEGRRYKADIEASHKAMRAFLGPIREAKGYNPRLVMAIGNHEHRIDRVVECDPKLDGVLSIKDLEYEDFGWEVHPFLKVVVIEGVAFSHYFTTGVMGRPAGTAAAQLRVAGMSCFAGHQQGKQITYGKRADGAILTSIISGSTYEHEESYLGQQGNNHWRGFWLLHDVKNGAFDELPISLSYINQRYAQLK